MVGSEFMVNALESEDIPHSLVTAKITVCTPAVEKLIFSGMARVDVAGLPPEKLQA
jgi:hypothetical protein